MKKLPEHSSTSINNCEDLLKYQTFSFKMMGVVPFDWESSIAKSVKPYVGFVKTIYSLIVIFLPIQQCILLGFTCYNLRNEDLWYLADLIASLCMFAGSGLVTLHFYVKQDEIKYLIDYVNKNFKRRSEKGLSYVTTRKSKKIAHWVSVIWSNLCGGSVFFWTLKNIYYGIREFPLPCAYPFDAKLPYIFELVYFIQVVSHLQMVFIYTCASVMFVSMVMMTCSQFDMIFCELKNLPYTAMIYANFDPMVLRFYQIEQGHEEVNQYYCSDEYDEFFVPEEIFKECVSTQSQFGIDLTPTLTMFIRKAVQNCVDHHVMIFDFGKKLESFNSFLAFLRVGEMTLQLCFLAFVAADTVNDVGTTFRLCEYLVLTLIDLSLFTYPPEMLRQQSVRIGEAIMRAPWPEFCNYFRDDIMIIQTCALRPITLSGAKFLSLDIDRLIAVVRTAFSYFTLLQTLAIRDE